MTPQARARQAIGLLDLTSLNDADDAAAVAALAARAATPLGPVAALCVWPRFVAAARAALPAAAQGVRIAAVANFPHGGTALPPVLAEIEAIVAAGGDEIDLVFPYPAWLAGRKKEALALLAAARRGCEGRVLKVILETGALDEAAIAAIAREAIAAGADFIKTSTGKIPLSATPAAARIMLEAIRAAGGACGFKAAGGIRDAATAALYLDLAAAIMGEAWIAPRHFRLGASAVLDDLVAAAQGGAAAARPREGY